MSWRVEHGEYDHRDGWVRLWCETDERWFSRRSLRVVTWGDRTYLVDEWCAVTFCDEINIGSEPRGGRFLFGFAYLRRGDERRAAKGLPAVAPEWRPLLLEKPLEGHVTRVRADGTAEIDRGRKDGLRERMPLVIWYGDSGHSMLVSVVSVEESTGVIADDGIAERFPDYPKIAPGDRVSSRWFEREGSPGEETR